MPRDPDSIVEDLDKEYAPAWRPEPGETIVGVVVDITELDRGYGPYPVITLRTEDGEHAVHCFHEVLSSELGRLAPKVGEELGIRYGGKHPERGYHRYRVRRGGESADVDWARYGETASLHAPLDEDE